jgi:nucleoid DNA-binding protein
VIAAIVKGESVQLIESGSIALVARLCSRGGKPHHWRGNLLAAAKTFGFTAGKAFKEIVNA